MTTPRGQLVAAILCLQVAGCERGSGGHPDPEALPPAVQEKLGEVEEYLANQPYPGKEDFERYRKFHLGVIAGVRSLGLRPGEKKKVPIEAFEVRRPLALGPLTRGEPPVTAYLSPEGVLYVKILTLDLHHAGAHGYLYCDAPRTASLAVEEIFLGAGDPGPLLAISEHWYVFRVD